MGTANGFLLFNGHQGLISQGVKRSKPEGDRSPIWRRCLEWERPENFYHMPS